jgi:hypothetical protein
MSNYVSDATYQVIVPDGAATVHTIAGATQAHHVELTALGTPPVQRWLYRHHQADGGVDQGFRLEPRRLAWELFVQDEVETAFDAKLQALYRLFKPYEEALKIKVTRSGGAVRQLDCFVQGPVELAQSNQLGFSGIVKVPLVAPDPLWYAPTQKFATTTIPTSGATFNVGTQGNYETWPVITVTGPVADLVLTTSMVNVYRSVTAVIDLTGVSIAAGDTRVIDLRPGKKTVVDSAGANKLSEMVNQSWVNFRLWPAPFKASGTNTISYTWSSRSTGAFVQFGYYDRYVSL